MINEVEQAPMMGVPGTILIVDDTPTDRKLASGILKVCPDWTICFAEDGAHALEVMKVHRPDLILTDLMMPKIDGLKLVKEVRTKYPSVPVILMTSQGSEEIAVRALKEGAASYVPKSLLPRSLPSMVNEILALTRTSRHQERLSECLVEQHFRFDLDNDCSLVPPIVDRLREPVQRLRLCDETGLVRVGIALEEALLNALYHGNLEVSSTLREGPGEAFYELAKQRRSEAPYCDRRIRVTANVNRQQAVFTVSDDGPGFDPTSLPDPTLPEYLERASGRGLLLIRTFMDEVHFNANGNEITMVKRAE